MRLGRVGAKAAGYNNCDDKVKKIWRLPGPQTPPACDWFEWGTDTVLNKVRGANKFMCTYDQMTHQVCPSGVFKCFLHF